MIRYPKSELEKLSLEEIQELYSLDKQILKDKAKDDYLSYVHYVHYDMFIEAEHIKFISDKIDACIKNKQRMLRGEIPLKNQYMIIHEPPRHGKSMNITETLPSYYMGKFPEHRIIVGCYNTTFATKFGKKNRRKVQEFGEDIFNIRLDKSTSSGETWNLDNGVGGMISRGLLAGITGEGADLLVIDDPIKNREEANSKTMRDKMWDEWIDSCSSRLHPGAIVIVIMTRWHQDDLVGRLTNPEYGEPYPWDNVKLPLEAEENDPLGREIGEPLWPERYGHDFIEVRKRYPQSFNSLYQGRPSSEEGDIFKRDWWEFFNYVGDHMFERMTMSVDATFKDSLKSDMVAIGVWGKKGPTHYLVDVVNARMGFLATCTTIENLKAKYPSIKAIIIEDKANGPAIIDTLKRTMMGVIPIEPKGGKIARAEATAPFVEAGDIRIRRGQPWVHDYLEQHAAFPNAAHDDMVDQQSQYLNWITNNLRGGIDESQL